MNQTLIFFKISILAFNPFNSSKFSIGQSTSTNPLFIWYEGVLKYFLWYPPYPQIKLLWRIFGLGNIKSCTELGVVSMEDAVLAQSCVATVVKGDPKAPFSMATTL